MARVSFPELPPNVHLEKGDLLDCSCELTDAKKNILANTATFQAVKVVYTATARHLASIKRNGAFVWHYGP